MSAKKKGTNTTKDQPGVNEIAILVIDQNLQVEYYTPILNKLLDGLPHATTQSSIVFSSLKIYRDLEEDVQQVINKSTVAKRKILAKSGQWYQTYAFPYYGNGDHAGGVVITFTDTEKTECKTGSAIQEEELFQSFADIAPALLWVTDPIGVCTFLSRAWYEYTGQTEETGLGFGWIDAIHPDDQVAAKDIFLTATKYQKAFQLDYRLRYKDGNYRWAIDAGQPRFSKTGEFLGYVGSVIDIHDRKQTEEALQRSERQARSHLDEVEAIYATAPVGLCVLDTDLRFMRINKLLAEMNGFSVEYHLGKTVREIIPDVADEVEPMLREVIESGEPILNFELVGETFAQPGVQRTWVEHWFPFKNNSGEVIGINIVTEDVTDRKRAEAASRENEERYRRLFNANDDGFCVCQMLVDETRKPYDYRFLEINHTFEDHTGLKDAQGKTALELVPDLEPYWIETYGKVALTGESVSFEQGSQAMGRWFEVKVFPFGSPESLLFAIQFREISERKHREAELQHYREKLAHTNEQLAAINEELAVANQDLISSNRELSEINLRLRQVNADLDSFVYTASHDLKTPIANIHGLLYILKRNLPADCLGLPDIQKTLGMMAQSVDRFMKTIADLSDIARLQKETDQPVVKVELKKIIEDVCLDLASSIEEANAQLDISIDTCGPIRFAIKNLRSVVYNLLSNAIKYRDPSRKLVVQIHCEELGDYQVLTVTDNGLGMDLSHDKRLFTMFQRLHDHVEGTGVGLYIVKKIVENAGGKIEVESKVGRGSTFKVFFNR
uniref:histidine kinase n=1 Tax=Roseihalotalea indica TaxID=2867963 RepID=A0AA49GIH1_9BACT|nr:PAS domain S-box protein [Tunicatimonas sp. TK19036]